MTRIPSLAALALAAVAFSPLAQAQYDQPIGQPLGQPWGTVPFGNPTYGSPGYDPYGGPGITCESRDGGYTECAAPFRGRPVVTETLSSSPCTRCLNISQWLIMWLPRFIDMKPVSCRKPG